MYKEEFKHSQLSTYIDNKHSPKVRTLESLFNAILNL